MSRETLTDDFGTSTGLPEDITGDVVEAWFGKNEQAEGEFADKQFLWLKLINIEGDYDGDEYTTRLGVGNGWVAVDGGERIVREDGSDKKFNQNTALGMAINRMLGELGGKEGKEHAEKFVGALDALSANAGKIANKQSPAQQYASVWVGLRIRFVAQEFSSTINGEESTWNWLLPAEFKGVVGSGASTTTAAAPAESNGNGGGGDLLTQLTDLAKTCDSHGEFVSKALAVPGVSESDLLAQVADEGDAGIYAKARA